MSERYELWVPGAPKPKERPRFRSRRRGGAYTPESTHLAEDAIAHAYMEAGGPRFEGPIGMHVDYYAEGQRIILYEVDWKSPVRADLDNLLKLTSDALQDKTHAKTKPAHRRIVAYPNDQRIVAVSGVKHAKGAEPE